jgi:hypothetical protein
MSYFDDASLVMIPSGYKDQKVYSVKPIDGSGDLTFTRSNDTATRVGPERLDRESSDERTASKSNSFDTTWVNSDTTETGGQSGYDGSSDAWLLDISGGTDSQYIGQSISVSGVQTFSFYAKAGSKNWVMCLGIGASIPQVYFDLQNGVVGTESNATGAIVSVGNGWYRCSMSHTQTISSVRIYVATADNDITQSSGNILIQDAQIEAGDIATEPILTTSAAVSVGPVANLPRLDYLGSSCPRLILEGQRTNLNTFSDGFTNGWTASGGTITATANYGISPDGYQNSTRIQFASANLIWRKSVVGLTGNVGTWSLYIKGTEGETLNITYGGVDLLITLGSGWNRYSVTGTGTIDEVFLNTFSGSTARDIEVYGGQAEIGAYATSYIPTLGAAVTRGEDACSKTGISSLFGSAFTIFVDVLKLQDTGPTRYLVAKGTGGTYDNWIAFEKVYEGVSLIVTDENAATLVNINKANIPVGQRMKIAARCENGSYAFYVNGEQIGVSSAAFTPAVSSFDFHYYDYLGTQTYNQAMILQPLTNAQLAELTTI